MGWAEFFLWWFCARLGAAGRERDVDHDFNEPMPLIVHILWQKFSEYVTTTRSFSAHRE